ncbi:hypothetical protein [Eubacterium barkeri]|uniref:Uncharacterized protein n=1 Tax=Eubacterium barkeri TaxID=1528 RepID=A0A1H3HFT5_EUBBA|nr:hypothetical protein [Eubacterium barkeri]SDY13644.1 hypothetical protein SAMN04488579_11758 [Eubacterium barkeri]
MSKINTVLLCLVVGCLLAVIGVGVGTGLMLALVFVGWPMIWVMIGIALVSAAILWVAYGRYQD